MKEYMPYHLRKLTISRHLQILFARGEKFMREEYGNKYLINYLKNDQKDDCFERIAALGAMLRFDKAERDELKFRSLLKAYITENEKGEKVVYAWVSGMDCDCSQYGYVQAYPADYEGYRQAIEKAYEWADGPMSIDLIHPSTLEEAKKSQYSHDLAAEAFEDGHPHVVYPR